MELPDLCLLPHEAGDLAPGEPLCAPATHRLTSRKHPEHVYLARWVKMGIGPDSEYIWAARRESVPDAPLLRYERDTSDLKQLHANFMRGKFERRLFFDRDSRLASTRDWHFGLWLSEVMDARWFFAADREVRPRHDPLYQPRFRWPHLADGEQLSRQWRTNVSDKQLEQEVGAMLRDSDSDASFTHRWLQLGARERDEMLFGDNRQNFEGCERVLRCILHSDDRWENEEVWTWIVNLAPYYVGCSNHEENVARGSEIHGDSGHFDLSGRLSRLLQLAIKHYDPSLNGAFAQTSVFQAIWSGSYGEWQVPVAAPTAHERLEAHLQLRQWLQGKVTSAELTELMPQ